MTTGNSSWMQLPGYGGAPIHQGSFVQENAPATEAITQALPEQGAVEDHEIAPELVVQGVKARYQLERPLGQGGSGSVHRAICLTEDTDVPRWVALKTLVGLDDHISRLTLKRELSSLLAISSDRIPKVWDWSIDGPQHFVVLEHYPMGSLNRILAKVGRLDIEQCWVLFNDLLEALRAAHAASVLHLDIKPGNVLVDETGRFVLTDFGISQGASARMPTGVGTRGYQAPEQRWRATALYDMRTDLYGVGATMWAACTGVNLASQRASSLWAKTRDEPYGLPPLEDFLPFCAPEFSELVKSLLVQSSTRRPGSAAEVLQRVQQASRGLFTPHAMPGDPMTPTSGS
ncbi:MAG: serine/threonine protein kinase [Proteobacteria bacterium]|nr:serine/threonine protein kinase [Pseudomonadota bacterium]MCP4921473.1 serine/threonine protein kinase [Pseudomonadota bacterium]